MLGALVKLFDYLSAPDRVAVLVIEIAEAFPLFSKETDRPTKQKDSPVLHQPLEMLLHSRVLNRFITLLTISSSICVVVPVTSFAMSFLV